MTLKIFKKAHDAFKGKSKVEENLDKTAISSGLQDVDKKCIQRKHQRRKNRDRASSMEVTTTVAEVHKKSSPARVHSAARRNRSQSRHEKHKCHKHKQRLEDNEMVNQVTQLKTENYILNRRLNASMSSLDSGLPTTDGLPPFEIDLKKAYQHVKQENSQLFRDLKASRLESEKLKSQFDKESAENSCLKDDVAMLKNLVYRLNVELEKYLDLRSKNRSDDARAQPYQLPKYYNKDFLKPILPLLRAYTETIQEKNELIEQLEMNFDKFNLSFNEILKENETLYKELEAKLTRSDDSLIDELQILRNELQMTKKEKELFENQSRIESDKLREIQAVYQTKVSLLERERESAQEKLQDARAEVYTLQGKHSVVKHELERLRCEHSSSVPIAVHSASVAECKRLFQNLKHEHDSEKQEWLYRIKDFECKLARKDEELRKNEQERLSLEQGNFDLSFECDTLRQRLAGLEKRLEDGRAVEETENDREDGDQLRDVKFKLTEALRRITDLEGRLQRTKKKLKQSMEFAEDLVKEQEGLLAQLHEKQRENSAMALTFGSLKKKLKSVEKGASAGLDSVEQTIKSLRDENNQLVAEVERLKLTVEALEKDQGLKTEDTSSQEM